MGEWDLVLVVIEEDNNGNECGSDALSFLIFN